MKKIFLFLSVFLSAPGLLVAQPNASKELEANLNNAIHWAEHLNFESERCGKADKKHVHEEIHGIRSAFSAMDSSYQRIARDTPDKIKSGRFVEYKKSQEGAVVSLHEFEFVQKAKKLDCSKMKESAEKTLAQLRKAKEALGMGAP